MNAYNVKVAKFVRPFNEDGKTFIQTSTDSLLDNIFTADITPSHPRHKHPQINDRKIITAPKTFSHYVLNLPASAITFLRAFIGLYAGHEKLFTPHSDINLPMVHVYCFNTKSGDNKKEAKEICEAISWQIGYEVRPGKAENEAEVGIWDVRDVAPLKRMFCASFRLPKDVAFRARQKSANE